MKHYLTDLRSKLVTAEKCPSMMRGGYRANSAS